MSFSENQELLSLAVAILALALIVVNTLRVRANRRYVHGERKFRNIAEHSPQAIFVIQDNRFLFVNDRALEIVEMSREEALGADVRNFIECVVNPQQRQNLTEQYRSPLAARDYIGHHEIHVRTPKGTERWLNVYLSAITYEGKRALQGVVVDITEQKTAAESIRKSEEAYRSLTSNIPVMIFRARPDWSSEFVLNSEFVCGHTPDEFGAGNLIWLDIVHPDDRKLILDQASELAKGTRNIVQEYRIIDNQGNVRWVEDHKSSRFRDGKDFLGVDGIVFDVTERKREESALRESEERYRALFDHAPDAVLEIDANTGTFVTFNDRAHENLGYTREEFAQLGIADIEVIESQEEVMAHIARITGRGYDSFETRHRTKSGEVRDILVECRIIHVRGRKLVQSIGHDITELKQAQAEAARFKIISDRANYGTAILDLDGNLTYVNECFAAMHGYAREELIGENMAILYSEEQLPQAHALNEELRRTGQYRTQEAWHIRRDNSVFPVLINGVQVKDEGGRAMFVAVTAIDITATKQAEIALKDSEERLHFVLDNTLSILLVLDCEGIVRYTNRTLPGLAIGDVVGASATSFVADIDQEMVVEIIQNVVETGTPADYECRGHGPQGTTWYDCHLSPVMSDGQVVAITLSATDVSRRKAIEVRDAVRLRLLENLRTAASVDECLEIGCRSIRDAGLFSRAVLTLHNHSREIVNIGYVGLDERTVQAARNAPAPEIKLAREMTCEKYRIGNSFFIPREVGLNVEVSHRSIPQAAIAISKGDNAWVPGDELFTPILSDEGEYIGWLSVDTPIDGERPTVDAVKTLEEIVDIVTQRVRRVQVIERLQESETRYATLLTSAPDGILASNLRTRKHVFANPAICDMTGYGSEAILQMDMDSFYPKEFRGTATELLAAVAEGKIGSASSIPIIRKDGTKLYVDITGGRAQLDGEDVIVASFRDVSELREKERLLTKQKKRLKKLSNLMIELQENDRQLVARELHDSVAQKLALAKIRLEKAALNVAEQGKESFREASATISDAVGDLRNISASLRPQLLDDLGLVAAVKWYLEQGDGDTLSSCSVVGSEYALDQHKQVNIFRICQEMVLNAYKHSGAKNLDVKLEFHPGEFVLSVADDGKGFDVEKVMAQGPSISSFGLTNIAERVDMMGGSLEASSSQGSGTCYRLSVLIE